MEIFPRAKSYDDDDVEVGCMFSCAAPKRTVLGSKPPPGPPPPPPPVRQPADGRRVALEAQHNLHKLNILKTLALKANIFERLVTNNHLFSNRHFVTTSSSWHVGRGLIRSSQRAGSALILQLPLLPPQKRYCPPFRLGIDRSAWQQALPLMTRRQPPASSRHQRLLSNCALPFSITNCCGELRFRHFVALYRSRCLQLHAEGE